MKADRKKLIHEIMHELQVKEEQALELCEGLYAARNNYDDMKGVYSSEDNLKEYRIKLESAHDAIKKFNNIFSRIPEMEREAFDTHYGVANKGDTLMIEINDPEFTNDRGHTSGILTVTTRIERALKLAESDLPKRNESDDRSTDSDFIAAVQTLAEFFAKVCPKYKVSRSTESKFHRYALIWFNNFHSKEDGWRDVSHKIHKALNSPGMKKP